ncbi:MAG: FAD-dependent oxidoreductase [Clostridiaceae bacterium]|nr:FAD-dependent oxidoreductase [Clostridiaceae bacterium]
MKKPVLVIGGGIAGIQASLDLAEMGIPVFLVEKTPSIGGRMAQLDKTFPTNDCSACILAPKVTSCFNHPLVKTFTWSEVLEIKGEAPDFTAVIRKRARFVDEDKCTGCSECTLKCPIEEKNEFDMGLGKRHAIFKPFAQAVPNKVTIDKKGTSPCKYTCPAHIDAHGYVALIGQGRYEEALELVRRATPFAGVLGRVCFHPCEGACSRQYVDAPISIAALKRFIADHEVSRGIKPAVRVDAGQKDAKVAIIGSGPAGLNCAYQLALMGYKVEIFEALGEPGGMLRVGIPGYRMDKKVLDREIDIIRNMGVKIHCNMPIGRDLTLDDLKKQGFKAFFLAIGAHRDVKLGVKGEELPGVIPGVEFLRKLNLGEKVSIGKRVLVVGGGNVAMDAARSARRLGAEVTVVYRRTEKEMPASEWEIKHAKEEGVRFEFLVSPVEVAANANGSAGGLKCVKNRLGKPDKSGRRRPEPIENSEHVIECDTIIVAIGQRVDTTLVGETAGSCFDSRGQVICDLQTMRTNIEGVFAGGDAVTGPATVIEAIAAGNRAARSIHNYLENGELPVEPYMAPRTPIEDIDLSGLKPAHRANMPVIELEKRVKSFEEVELGLPEEEARREALRCADCSICSECKACEAACKAGAVCHDQEDEIITIPVGAVILASGYDTACEIPPEFGYGRYPDVVTGMEYERILSASGPFSGHVQHPSDGKAPEKVAFIQCVASRDARRNEDYCSSVCCMYAVKEAIITKEHLPSVKEVNIFYMDMRAYGKDFDKYISTAKDKYGVGFIRSRGAGISRNDRNGKLVVEYCDENGNACVDEYDMVVLSTGLKPAKSMKQLLGKSRVKTDRYGFVWVDETNPPKTSAEGILACGASAGPKDIPETVVEASAAAAAAAGIAGNTRGKAGEVDANVPGNFYEYILSQYFKAEENIPERDVSKEPVRIGVFICHCGVNIGGYVDVKAVVEYARTLPYVEYAEDNLYTCSVDSQKAIADKIKEYGLNRVVVASCTPRTHEPLFQGVLKKAGLNPYLFSMANIRDQCSWVHMYRYEDATEKSKDLVRMAVSRAIHARQLTRQKIDVTKSALVIGGGMAGMTAALEIASMGYKVYLVEKKGRLGGNAARLNVMPSGRPAGNYVNRYINEVLSNKLIEVFLNSEIKSIDGYVGKYKTVISSAEGERELEHGVVIVAVGAEEHKPSGYLYGREERVVTQLELEEMLNSGGKLDAKNVVMIQCVGSRDEDRAYCSRVCCSQAIKNALLLKEQGNDTNVTILYRDIRAYGMNEINYARARMQGVQFIRYDTDEKPSVYRDDQGRLRVKVYDKLLQDYIELEADLIVLASAIAPRKEDNSRLAQFLKVPLNEDGFFLEAHAKLRPVDFATDGVYLCGLAHSPKNLKESITQGKAAAARAATVISKEYIEAEGTIARVSEELCVACGACEKVCAYKAISVQEVQRRKATVKKAVVNAALCKGCGTCSAICRCGAIDVDGFSDRQIVNELEFLFRRGQHG